MALPQAAVPRVHSLCLPSGDGRACHRIPNAPPLYSADHPASIFACPSSFGAGPSPKENRVVLAPMIALAVAVALAQDPQGAPPRALPPRQAEALRVFLDCQDECDGDFLRTEVTFVNWIRDRYDGQILVLVTSQTTGGRGTDYAFTLIGQR